jgi:hypothetical protein
MWTLRNVKLAEEAYVWATKEDSNSKEIYA